MEEIIGICHAALAGRDDVEVGPLDGCEFSVGDEWTVELDGIDVDEEDEGDGVRLTKRRARRPESIEDHWEVLEACLAALKAAPAGRRITRLTVDGDHKDCEAIFFDGEDWLILKVR